MSLRHGLLGLLSYESMTGYDLNKDFNDSLGHFWQAKASQIYRELDAMEHSGWLTSERVIQDEKPNKRVYSITEAGRAEFLRWLATLDPLANTPRTKNAFMMRIFFGGELSTEQTLKLLHSGRELVLDHVRQMEAIINNFDAGVYDGYNDDPNKVKYWKLTALSGEIMSKANLEWLDKAIAILEEKE